MCYPDQLEKVSWPWFGFGTRKKKKIHVEGLCWSSREHLIWGHPGFNFMIVGYGYPNPSSIPAPHPGCVWSVNVQLSAMPREINVTVCNAHLLDQQPRHTVPLCSQKSFLLSYYHLSTYCHSLTVILWSPSIILLEGPGRALGRENFNLTLLAEVEVIVLYPYVHHAEKLPDQVIKIWSLVGLDIKLGRPQEYERRDEMQELYQCTIGICWYYLGTIQSVVKVSRKPLVDTL